MRRLSDYRTWLFDCDGVILNSNALKTEAFRIAASEYGETAAAGLVAYHREHGGISRFEKVNFLFRELLGRNPEENEKRRFLDCFAASVREGLETCETDGALENLISLMPQGCRRFIVSGGAQDELRAVFSSRNLDIHFDAIFGSPDTKMDILARESRNGNIQTPAIFIGDSRLDYEAAISAGADFVFVTHWTEFESWENYFADKSVLVVSDLSNLVDRWA